MLLKGPERLLGARTPSINGLKTWTAKVTLEDGYSAVELLIALVLLGILLTLGLYNYSKQIPHYELREASRALVSDLRKIRQMAVAEGRSFTVAFYPGQGEECDLSYAGMDAYCEEDNSDLLQYMLPAHVHFGALGEIDSRPGCSGGCSSPPTDGISFPGDSATFNPNGTVSGMGTVYLSNAPFRNESHAVTVNITGRVRLWKWAGSEWQ